MLKRMTMIALCCSVAVGGVAAESFTPDGRVKSDDYTVLMAVDAPLPEGSQRFQHGGHGKFFVQGWTNSQQVFCWTITVSVPGDYVVNVLTRREDGPPPDLIISCGNAHLTGQLAADVGVWDRQTLDGVLPLDAGQQTITLQSTGDGFSASLMSIELVRPLVRDQLAADAKKLRADSTWLQRAKFGLMFHWTSQSCPRHGHRKPYAEAVKEFDVETFATRVQEMGAGFVVFTTSHAEMYFPAPIKALDHILPGRTSERDLIADLAAALGRRGVKLMLYYHIGAGSDPAWLKASGFWKTDTREVFANWNAVIGEIGERYGDKLTGWWFDDGAVSYYYRSAPWQELLQAARAGHPQRLVGFNPWELPSPTAFQDLYLGEGNRHPGGAGDLLKPGGDGRYPSGTYQGLQGCATLIMENDWVHSRPETEIGNPRWNERQLARLLNEFAVRHNVPIFNLEIYQDGGLSPNTVNVFRKATGSQFGRR